MEAPFPFESMLLFGFLSILLLVGIFIRAKIAPFQKLLIPSCLIGGFLGLLVVTTNIVSINSSSLESFAYHFFNISFISIGLTQGENRDKGVSRNHYIKGSGWMAMTQGITFPAQAVLGGTAVLIFGFLGISLFPTFGFLIPLGFNEGPGQALSIGKVWEGFGFEYGATIGLTFATIGYFFAFFVGVPLVNWGIRKGHATYAAKKLSRAFLTGILDKHDRPSAGKLTLHNATTETFAFHSAMIGLVYVITYVILKLVGSVLPPDIGKILWGFFFMFGLAIAYAVKGMMRRTGIDFLMDAEIQRRVTGWAVDFLIVATVAAIQLAAVWQYILPISIMAVSGGVLTLLIVLCLGRRTESFNLERTVAIYGTVTGTVSCGLLLLRIVDPDFRTPVATEIALMNVFVVPLIGGYTVLANGPVWWDWSVGLTVLVYSAILVLVFVMMKMLKLLGPVKF